MGQKEASFFFKKKSEDEKKVASVEEAKRNLNHELWVLGAQQELTICH